MPTELPDLAALRHRLLRRFIIKVVLGDLRRRCRCFRAGVQQTEVEALKIKALQLDLEQVGVPLGDLAGLVVQDAVLPLLRLAEPLRLDDLDLVPSQLLDGLVSGVSGEDHARLVYDDGRAVPALPDALRHGVHGLVVPPGVPFVRLDLVDRQRLQLQSVVLLSGVGLSF